MIQNKNGWTIISTIIVVLVVLIASSVCFLIIRDYNEKVKALEENNSLLESKLENISIENKINTEGFVTQINSLNKQVEQLTLANEILIKQIWELIQHPQIITIIEVHHSSSGSNDNDDEEEEECLPCPQLQRCPEGKVMESDGEDECGCIINPRCVNTANIK